MRLNKKKLAALAMSAVMAASTMPFSVLAEEFTDMGEAIVATEEGDVVVNPPVVSTKVTFDNVTKIATFTYPDGTTATVAAKYVVVTELTCEQNETKAWRATDPATNVTYQLTTPDITKTAVGHHTWDTSYWETTKEPSCKEDADGNRTAGVQTEYHKCKVCGTVEPVKLADGITVSTRPIAAPAHTYGETYTKVTSKSNNLDDNLKLITQDADGWYKVASFHKCTVCQKEDPIPNTEVTYEVLCDASAIINKVVTVLNLNDADSNIKSGITNNGDVSKTVNGKVVANLPADKTIQLNDCTKDGVYWVKYLNSSDKVVSIEKHIVPAHHCVELRTETTDPNGGLLTVVTDTNGNQRVKNLSCSKEIKYTEITYCTAEAKEINREEKTAQPEGTHRNNRMTDAKNWIKALADADGYVDSNEYGLIVSNTNKSYYNYKIDVTGDCSKELTVTVTFLCDACKEELSDTVTVKCKEAILHTWTDAEKINVVEPTCFKAGSYDTVRTCKVCGKEEIVRTGVEIPATGEHSFIDEKTGVTDYTDVSLKFTGTKVVDRAGANVDKKGQVYDTSNALYTVSSAAVIKCDICGEEIAQTPAVTLTVVDVKKETEKEAGSITLKATWYTTDKKIKLEDTYTVPYYSNVVSYLERDPEKDPINGLHKDEDGVWRYYENNEVTDFTGIAEYQGGKFFVANGVLCSDAKGLNLYNGEWYFLAGGQIQTQVTGLAMYNGEWFFLTDGKLDRTKSGLVEYDGAKFIIAKGELQRYSGLWQDPADGTWYFAALGQIQEQYTGTAIYDGQTFELVNGKLVR